MKVLFVEISPPYPLTHGQRLRAWSLLRALAAQGHEITLVAFDAPDSPEGLVAVKALCRQVEYVPPKTGKSDSNPVSRMRTLAGRTPHGVWKYSSKVMARRVSELLTREAFDLVVCDEPYMFGNIPRPCPVPLVLDTNDAAHLILERYAHHTGNPAMQLYCRLEAAKLRRWERQACEAADMVIACSEVDARFLKEVAPGARFMIAPNVIDVATYTPGGPEEPNTLLYCGSVEWHPNRDAVEFFLSQIMPRLLQIVPKARLIVTGPEPARDVAAHLRSLGPVEFTGFLPDVKPVIAQTAVSIVPLRIGSGTRLKILEAAAMEKAVVSTTLGAEGLQLVDGAEIMIADAPEEFALALAGLLKDPQERAEMGAAARRRVVKQYSQEALEAALRDLVPTVVGRSGTVVVN